MKKARPILVRADRAAIRDLDKLKRAVGQTRSTLIREAVTDLLAKYGLK